MEITPLIDSFEKATVDLLAALEWQEPAYLEYLERRGELLAQLIDADLSNADESVRLRLLQAREAGEAIDAIARRMRESAAEGLRHLEWDRQVAHLLAATAKRDYCTLELNA